MRKGVEPAGVFQNAGRWRSGRQSEEKQVEAMAAMEELAGC